MEKMIFLVFALVGTMKSSKLEITSDNDWAYVRENEMMTKMHQTLQNINENLEKLTKTLEVKADDKKQLVNLVQENKLNLLEYKVAAAEEDIRSLKNSILDATQPLRMRQRTVTTETEMTNAAMHFASSFGTRNYASPSKTQNETGCPSKFVELVGRCYFFSNYIIQDWSEAWKHCQELDRDAVLVSIETENEWNVIESYLRAKNLHKKNWWTSGSDGLTGDKWMWMGSNVPFNFTNWAGSEPNGGSNENCVHIFEERDLGWNDYLCSPVSKHILLNFICELQ